jgi:hypothetical protein
MRMDIMASEEEKTEANLSTMAKETERVPYISAIDPANTAVKEGELTFIDENSERRRRDNETWRWDSSKSAPWKNMSGKHKRPERLNVALALTEIGICHGQGGWLGFSKKVVGA